MDTGPLEEAIKASPHVGARLSFVLFLLIIQAISLILELCVVHRKPHFTLTKRGLVRPGAGPELIKKELLIWLSRRNSLITLFLFVVGIAFSAATFNRQAYIQSGINLQCEVSIDGDIAGMGVRVSIWVQEAILVLAVITSAFYLRSGPTVVKEFSAGLVVTHLSLGLSLLVQMHRNQLTALDAAVGAIILDSQGLTLSLALPTRDILASRWQVLSVLSFQTVGLVIVGILMNQFAVGSFVTDKCQCFSFFWWAWRSSCSALSALESATFWIYYSFRWLGLLRDWIFGLTCTFQFHIWEKQPEFWEYVPSTLGVASFPNAVFALASVAAVELTLAAHYAGSLDEPPFTIGQITAIVVAAYTFTRGAFSFGQKTIVIDPETRLHGEGEAVEGGGYSAEAVKTEGGDVGHDASAPGPSRKG